MLDKIKEVMKRLKEPKDDKLSMFSWSDQPVARIVS